MTSAKASMAKNTRSISLFALASGVLLGTIFWLTEARIEQQKIQAQSKAINEIVPTTLRDNLVLANSFELSSEMKERLNLPLDAVGYIATLAGKPTAVVVPVITLSGYSGAIEMIVAISSDNQVTGVRVIAHKETPGLGDKIEKRKSHWIDSFIGYSPSNPANAWAVKKDGGDFDQFTGATVTPRAVVKAVQSSVLAVADDHQLIFGGADE